MAKKNENSSILGGLLTDLSTGVLGILSDTTGGAANIINRIAGRTITVSKVLEVLDDLKISLSQYTTEKNVENILAKYIDQYFYVHRQYNIGGFLGLKIDLDINETVGIELKLAKELTTTNIERLLGQVIYYSKRKYGEKLIVLIVRTSKEVNTRIMDELEEIIQELGVTIKFMVVNPRK